MFRSCLNKRHNTRRRNPCQTNLNLSALKLHLPKKKHPLKIIRTARVQVVYGGEKTNQPLTSQVSVDGTHLGTGLQDGRSQATCCASHLCPAGQLWDSHTFLHLDLAGVHNPSKPEMGMNGQIGGSISQISSGPQRMFWKKKSFRFTEKKKKMLCLLFLKDYSPEFHVKPSCLSPLKLHLLREKHFCFRQ